MKKKISNIEEADDNAALIRGKIITYAITIERVMDFFLVEYFKPKNKIELYELILQEMNFEKKVQLIEKIFKNSSVDYKNIFQGIRKVQKERNTVAHWRQLYNYNGNKLIKSKIDFYKNSKPTITFSRNQLKKYEWECSKIIGQLTNMFIKIIRAKK